MNMKNLLCLLSCFWCLIGYAQNGPTVVLFSTQNFTGQALNNAIRITSLDTPYSTGNNVVGGVSITIQPVNGVVVTNLYPADYEVVINGVLKSWVITVPVTNGVVNAAAILKNGVTGLDTFIWTNALAGATINVTNIGQFTAAGTNASAVTNGAVVTVSGVLNASNLLGIVPAS